MSSVQKFMQGMRDAIKRIGAAVRGRFQKHHAMQPVKVPLRIGQEIVLTHKGRPMMAFLLVEVRQEFNRPNRVVFEDKSNYLSHVTVSPSVVSPVWDR